MSYKIFLSIQEKRILELLVKGWHPIEMPSALKLSNASVKFYSRLMRAKLNARTTAEAVAIAVANHLINLHDIPEVDE